MKSFLTFSRFVRLIFASAWKTDYEKSIPNPIIDNGHPALSVGGKALPTGPAGPARRAGARRAATGLGDGGESLKL